MNELPKEEINKTNYLFWIILSVLILSFLILLYFLILGSTDKTNTLNKTKTYSTNFSSNLNQEKRNPTINKTDKINNTFQINYNKSEKTIIKSPNESIDRNYKQFNISKLNISRSDILNISFNQSNNITFQNNSSEINQPEKSGELKVFYYAYYSPSIMSGIYNQYSENNSLLYPLMTYDIENDENVDVTLTFVSEILDYTSQSVDKITIPANSNFTINQNPLLKRSIDIRELTNANIHYKILIGDYTLGEETIPIKIYAKDTMIWGVYYDDYFYDQSYWIAAWVTPHISEVDELIRKSAEYHPDKSIQGYQCSYCESDDDWASYTSLQVKAIYDSLKHDYKMTYVNAPIAYSANTESSQRVKLPKDSIKLSSSNCIDGSVLFASALESIGINPYLEILPGHAFLCWDVSEYSATVDCLETTMIRDSEFEDANAEGVREYNEQIDNGNFDNYTSLSISIRDSRDYGIMPIV